MSSIDLSLGNEGVIEFSNGDRFWCPLIECLSGDTYNIRIESGWYEAFYKNGRQIHGNRLITSFTPCPFDDVIGTIKTEARP